MPRVEFTSHLKKHLDCPPQEVPGETLRDALEAVFETNPRLRGYLLEDHGALRKHVMVFVDNQVISDRIGLQDQLSRDSRVFVMQALSGG